METHAAWSAILVLAAWSREVQNRRPACMNFTDQNRGKRTNKPFALSSYQNLWFEFCYITLPAFHSILWGLYFLIMSWRIKFEDNKKNNLWTYCSNVNPLPVGSACVQLSWFLQRNHLDQTCSHHAAKGSRVCFLLKVIISVYRVYVLYGCYCINGSHWMNL